MPVVFPDSRVVSMFQFITPRPSRLPSTQPPVQPVTENTICVPPFEGEDSRVSPQGSMALWYASCAETEPAKEKPKITRARYFFNLFPLSTVLFSGRARLGIHAE